MRTTPRPPARATTLLLATALTVLLTTISCGSSDPNTDPPSTDPTIVDTTEGLGPDSERQRIFDESSAAYVEFWNIWLEANNPP
ncbi:MAG: hypothetical protein ACXVLK_16340, partial [Acidimicrobiales bacterium]